MGDRWGNDGPPADAYSRMSDPGRYADLHSDAADLAQELTVRHDVHLAREPVADPASRDADVPALHLVPARPGPVTLTFVLTGLPGLDVRLDGRTWLSLPHCGCDACDACDACDETIDECREQLGDLIGAAVAGSLGERLYRDGDGWAREQWARSGGGSRSSRAPVAGAALAELRAVLPGGTTRWEPWPAR